MKKINRSHPNLVGKLNLIALAIFSVVGGATFAIASDHNPLDGGYDPLISKMADNTDPNLSVDKWKEYQAELAKVEKITAENTPIRNEIAQLAPKQFSSQTSPEEKREIAEKIPKLRQQYQANQVAILNAQNHAKQIEDTWKSILKDSSKLDTFKTNIAVLANDASDATAKQNAQSAITALFPKSEAISSPYIPINDGKLHQIKQVAAGSDDTDAVNVAQLKRAEIHYFSINATEKGDNYSNDGAKHPNSLAISKNAMAIGVGAKATTVSSLAIGTSSLAGTEDCVSGRSCGASNTPAIAIGANARALNNGAISLGQNSYSISDNALAVGNEAKSEGGGTIAIGNQAQVVKQTSTYDISSSIAIGAASKVSGSFSIALGDSVTINAQNAVAIGSSAKINNNTGAGVALGSAAEVTATEHDREGGVALGSNSLADRAASPNNAGYDVLTEKASTDHSLAWSANAPGVSVGKSQNGAYALTRQIYNVAAGINDADAVNVAQLKQLRHYIDSVKTDITAHTPEIHYFSVKSSETGENSNADNNGAQSVNSLAIGPKAYVDVKSVNSVAIGQNARIESSQNTPTTNHGDNVLSGANSVAVGDNALTTQSWATAVGADTQAKGWGSAAFGRGAQAYGFNSVALGNNAKANITPNQDGNYNAYAVAIGVESKASGTYAVTIGGNADSTGTASVTVGARAKTTADRATSLGYLTNATLAGGVALGAGALTQADEHVLGYSPLGHTTLEEAIGKDQHDQYQQHLVDYQAVVEKAEKAQQDFIASSQKIKQLDDQLHDANLDAAKKAEVQQARHQEGQNWLKIVGERDQYRAQAVAKKAEADKIIATWESTRAGVSIGNSDTGISRQINNVAAGSLDTDAVNVAQLKQLANLPISFYHSTNGEALGNAVSKMPLNALHINFGEGLKVEEKSLTDGKKVLWVGLDKTSLKNDPDFKGDKGDTGLEGAQGMKGEKGDKGDAGINGKDGKNGIDGKDGKDGAAAKPIHTVSDDTNIELDEKPTHVEIHLNKTLKHLHHVEAKTFKSGNTEVNEQGIHIGQGDGQVQLTDQGLNNGGQRITRVAAGVNAMDAVNKGQLDQLEQRVQQKLDRVNKRADAGTASAIAQGAIPQISQPGNKGIGVGTGHYGNQSAISIGGSRMTDNGKWIFKGALSTNTQGKTGVSAGALYQW